MKDGQLKRADLQEKCERSLTVLSVAILEVFANIPSPFADKNGTLFQFNLWRYKSFPGSAKAIQSPHPGLKISGQS